MKRTCLYGMGGEGESVLVREQITITRDDLRKLVKIGRVSIKYGTAFDAKEPHTFILRVGK